MDPPLLEEQFLQQIQQQYVSSPCYFLSTVNLSLWRYLSYKVEICHMAVAVEAAAASCISNVAPIQVEALQNQISTRMPLKSQMCQAAVADSLAALLWCLLGAVCFLLECMWAAT